MPNGMDKVKLSNNPANYMKGNNQIVNCMSKC